MSYESATWIFAGALIATLLAHWTMRVNTGRLIHDLTREIRSLQSKATDAHESNMTLIKHDWDLEGQGRRRKPRELDALVDRVYGLLQEFESTAKNADARHRAFSREIEKQKQMDRASQEFMIDRRSHVSGTVTLCLEEIRAVRKLVETAIEESQASPPIAFIERHEGKFGQPVQVSFVQGPFGQSKPVPFYPDPRAHADAVSDPGPGSPRETSPKPHDKIML